MAKIFLSMSGEGRGHATRVQALVAELQKEHEVTLFAPGLAYPLLSSALRGVTVERIPGLLNRYTSRGNLDYAGTFLSLCRYRKAFPRLMLRLCERIRADNPELVITDFEPALPRAAETCGVPYMSINHQHFMVVSDLSGLPPMLRMHAFWMGFVVRAFYRHQNRTVVSSFFSPPLKRRYRNVEQVGVLLGPEVVEATPRAGDHVVAYVRRQATPQFIEALRSAGVPVIVYGLGRHPSTGNVRFKKVDRAEFVEDLASSRALLCTAGNQIVGESLYLGKPVLALPEPGNYEQHINAHYLREMHAGASVPLARCRAEDITSFLNELDGFALPSRRRRMNGTPRVFAAVQDQLGLSEEPPPISAPPSSELRFA